MRSVEQIPEPTRTVSPETTSPAAQSEIETPSVALPGSVNVTEESVTVAVMPDAALYGWEKVFSGMRLPVFLSGAGDSSGRLFIVTQPGVIYVARDGIVFDQPFLDIRELVSRPNLSGSYGERGLLGLAFHPQYTQNGFFFVNYTDHSGDTVIARYHASPTADQADPQSEVRLLTVEQPYANHNGGMLAFGPDGYLYIGLGDGGSAGDPQGNAQNVHNLLGKLLRIEVNLGDPYTIPADNPFASGGGSPEIWAYGLRNPWRFSFDVLAGDLFIGDVGQNQVEEVDFLAAGSPGGVNFGWNYLEGSHPYKGQSEVSLTLIDPIAEYSHDLGCSITGGVVYRGMNLPEWQGVYLYGDYCNGNVWGLLRNPDGTWQSLLLFQTGYRIASFGVDEAGEVYLLDHQQGEIYRLSKR